MLVYQIRHKSGKSASAHQIDFLLIGVARGSERGYAPPIFGIYSHVCFERRFQTK